MERGLNLFLFCFFTRFSKGTLGPVKGENPLYYMSQV